MIKRFIVDAKDEDPEGDLVYFSDYYNMELVAKAGAEVIKDKYAEIAALKDKLNMAFVALKESKACWDAAYTEGFPEAMNEAREGKPEKLVALLDRRLLFALAPIVDAFEKIEAPQ